MANIGQFGGMQALQNMGMPTMGFPQIPAAQQMGKQRGRVGKFFKGTPETFQQVPTQTMQGMQALQMLLSGGMKGLQDPYAGFDPIADQATEQFYSETVPSLAERFSAIGSDGSQRSSAFQGALGSAGSGLSRQLAALKSQYGLQNREGLLKQLQLGLTPQFDTIRNSRQPGIIENTPGLITKLLTALRGGI